MNWKKACKKLRVGDKVKIIKRHPKCNGCVDDCRTCFNNPVIIKIELDKHGEICVRGDNHHCDCFFPKKCVILDV